MILTDLQKLKIEAFCNDTEMYEAVKKVILASIYDHGVLKEGEPHDPLKNGAFKLAGLAMENPIPDEILGQHIRGMWAGVNHLVNGFNELDKIKAPKQAEESPYNEAI
jgi:hypothetical protein